LYAPASVAAPFHDNACATRYIGRVAERHSACQDVLAACGMENNPRWGFPPRQGAIPAGSERSSGRGLYLLILSYEGQPAQ